MRGKKLRDNGVWESSRMMIPEHKAAIQEHHRLQRMIPRPTLDVDAIEQIEFAINEALSTKTTVTMTVYDPFGEKTLHGYIEFIDPQLRRLRVGDDYVWFKDILRVELF